MSGTILAWLLIALQSVALVVLAVIGARQRRRLATLQRSTERLEHRTLWRRSVSAERSLRAKREAADALVTGAAVFERLADAVEDSRGTPGDRMVRSQVLRLLADDCRQSAAGGSGVLRLSDAFGKALKRVGLRHTLLKNDLPSVLALAALLAAHSTPRVAGQPPDFGAPGVSP